MDKKLVVIGGGTGTFPVLTGLKKYTSELVAVVTMMDSGGSSGRLRDEFGQLPAGDLRQALVALSKDTSVLRELFNYRYSKGEGLEGHSFGNLFLTALAEVSGGMDQAVAVASQILNVKGKVLPVTTDHATLVAEYEDGSVVRGEGKIDEPEHDGKIAIKQLSLDPLAKVFPPTAEAIEQADAIILGPGDIFTSLIPNLLVAGAAEAICGSSAKKIFVMNLMTKYGQTFGWTATKFVAEIERYLDKPCLDFVLINNQELPEEILQRYKQEGDEPVKDDLEDDGYKIIRTDLLASSPVQKTAGDSLKRSLIRHDTEKIASAIMEII
ncbi:MAG: YvcK family protein [bacterium]|nr:YvcK family protein [bacterium]